MLLELTIALCITSLTCLVFPSFDYNKSKENKSQEKVKKRSFVENDHR